ncbi:hypothetical protein [Streptomyces sp. NPDC005077]|uniref:hypothetical protein n=1 Tax=Streptomyces sp. NPDC005077 TaxID=3154292 RepID=UPI0033BB9612
MNGRTDTLVSVRHLPHHEATMEVFETTTTRHLGSASLAAQSRMRSSAAAMAMSVSASVRL